MLLPRVVAVAAVAAVMAAVMAAATVAKVAAAINKYMNQRAMLFNTVLHR